jgi:hypothetical protein
MLPVMPPRVVSCVVMCGGVVASVDALTFGAPGFSSSGPSQLELRVRAMHRNRRQQYTDWGIWIQNED